MPSYLETSAAIAREAGAVLHQFFLQRVAVELKDEHDLVTVADRTSEQLVIERLRANFPTHSIVAEESGAHAGSSEYCWYVDPLDGTTNFAHGFPMYNVSIGLEQGGELVMGVIFDPERNEMFTCERGSGAYLNGQRIRVSQVRRLEDALMATGFPSRKRHQNVNVHFFYQLAMITHGVRRAGAAALDLAYVACGRLDGFWEFGLHPWDMAAGILLVTEAGGRCSDMHGASVSLRGPHLLADNGSIHDETVAIFGEIYRGEYRYPMPEIK
ncbi:MAG TPA: inositol monophosphatase family protein [Bryobacteraceae bacterium]|nr:inositol monophosphatase family protein [Bryobacteraceae bacterium]